jgi:two-component system, OmpR family, KDP operon response regulator KdpE
VTDQRVLVVEDDAPLRSALVATLAADDLTVAEAATGEEALARLQVEGADLVLLDLMLPGADGMQVLTRVRTFSDVPVIVLTVRDSKQDKLAALGAGADDYVTKPFDSDELLARVRAALRRSAPAQPHAQLVVAGDVTIDRGRQVVLRGDDEVKLTPTEWQLLDLLLSHEGRLVTYATVSEEITTRTGELDRQGTRVFVAQLRKKLGDDATDPRLILTHFGLGVRWIGPLDGALQAP